MERKSNATKSLLQTIKEENKEEWNSTYTVGAGVNCSKRRKVKRANLYYWLRKSNLNTPLSEPTHQKKEQERLKRKRTFTKRKEEEQNERTYTVGVSIVRKFKNSKLEEIICSSKKRKKIRKEEVHSLMNICTENVNISPFDPQVEHILNSISFNDEIRQTLAAYHIFDYKSFKQLDEKQLLNMTRNVDGTAIIFYIYPLTTKR